MSPIWLVPPGLFLVTVIAGIATGMEPGWLLVVGGFGAGFCLRHYS